MTEEHQNETDKTQPDQKKRKAQTISLAEYESLQKQKRKKRFKLPAYVKIILSTPFLILFCCGLFILPFMLYQIATGKPASHPEEKAPSTYEQGQKKSANKN